MTPKLQQTSFLNFPWFSKKIWSKSRFEKSESNLKTFHPTHHILSNPFKFLLFTLLPFCTIFNLLINLLNAFSIIYEKLVRTMSNRKQENSEFIQFMLEETWNKIWIAFRAREKFPLKSLWMLRGEGAKLVH